MKKNKLLLNEDTTRKFMKYANIGPLAEGFLDQMIEEAEAVDEELEEGEELEESASIEETEELEEVSLGSLGEEDGLEDEEDLGAPEPELDPELDSEPELDAAPASDEEKVRELLDGVAALVKDVFDVDVGVEGGEAPEEEAPLDADPMVDLPVDGEEEEVDLEEKFDSAGISLEEDTWTEDKINEVTQRVAKRLLEMTKKS